MTQAQRIGQLFAVGLHDDQVDAAAARAIRAYHFGSVWFTTTTVEGASGVRSVADAVQALATRPITDGVRFYVGANQEGGMIQALRGPGFSTMPTALEQGALPTPTLRSDTEAWGRELLAAGVNLNFAPVMDVVPAANAQQNAPIGALEREFGHDPRTVGAHGVAFLRGMEAAGVATTAKHFPGLGRVTGNTDFAANVVDSVTSSNDASLGSFRRAIAAGVPMVMVALATYTRIDPDHLAVFSPVVMRLLRTTFGFDGVIVSDDLGAAAAISSMPPASRAIEFLQAGGDLIVSKGVGPAEQMAQAVVAKASSDAAFGSLVDDATMRVLSAKDASNLLPCGVG